MPRRSFRSARCLVTGASSGLGRALAEHLARAGAHVILTGRSLERLTAVTDGLVGAGLSPSNLQIVAADLTDPADRGRLLDRAAERFGALDLLINAAGIGAYGHFESHDESVLRQLFEINFFALAELTRDALPLLRRGESPALINIGSIVARRALPGRPEYSASKFAVAGLTEALRAEWSKYGIDVLLANPGFTATPFDQNLVINNAVYSTSRHRTMSPAAVASATLAASLRGRHELTLTPLGRMLLFANRLVPRLVDWGMNRWTHRLYPVPPPLVPLRPQHVVATPPDSRLQ